MPYPVYPAGRRITASLLQAAIPLEAMKAADTDRASTTTVTADPELVLALAASAEYQIEGMILTSCSVAGVSGGPDILCTLAGPAGAVGNWTLMGPSTAATSDDNAVRQRAFTLGSTAGYGHPNTNTIAMILHARIITTTAGTASFNWAQVASNAAATRVAAGSWLRATRTG
jgi:hypothetical protein